VKSFYFYSKNQINIVNQVKMKPFLLIAENER